MVTNVDTTSTIASVVSVPQNSPHDPLGKPETVSALFACPDFRDGFEASRAIFEEQAECDDLPQSEEEMISYITRQLCVTEHHRMNRFSLFLGHPALCYLYRIGFVVGYLTCLLATRPLWHVHPLSGPHTERQEEEAQLAPAATAASKKGGKSQRSPVPKYPNRLRACLKQEGYTVREVARETAIPEGTLRHWAAGDHVIPHAERARLAQVIGCTVEDLAPRRADEPGYGVPVSAVPAVGPDGWPVEMERRQ